MDGGFVALAFGFCAAMPIDGNQDIIKLGYVSNDECIVRVEIGDSHGETVTINSHEIGIEMLEGGAEVKIDELRFVIQKTEGA